jgi:hypothetical protein
MPAKLAVKPKGQHISKQCHSWWSKILIFSVLAAEILELCAVAHSNLTPCSSSQSSSAGM